MLSDLFCAVQQLHSAGLYSNVVELCSVANCVVEQSMDMLNTNQVRMGEMMTVF